MPIAGLRRRSATQTRRTAQPSPTLSRKRRSALLVADRRITTQCGFGRTGCTALDWQACCRQACPARLACPKAVGVLLAKRARANEGNSQGALVNSLSALRACKLCPQGLRRRSFHRPSRALPAPVAELPLPFRPEGRHTNSRAHKRASLGVPRLSRLASCKAMGG